MTAENEITISPNPAVGPVTVQMAKDGDYELTVVDSRGKVVKTGTFTNSTTFELTNSVSGTYMIQVKGLNNDMVVRKVVKN